MTTVVDLLEQSTSVIIDEHGNQRTTAEILETGRRLAHDLAAAGIAPGDRVAVQMANGPLYLDLLAAAAVGRFVIMSVNLRFADQLSRSLIERSGARLTLRNDADLPPSAPRRASEPDEATADDRYVIFTTSGTTSAPKLVVHQQRSVATHARDVASSIGYTDTSVVMVPLPLCGVFGFSVFWGAVAGNSKIIMPTAFEAEQTARLIEEHGVTSLHGSDDMFHRLLATNADLSTIDCSGYGRFNSALDGIVERCEARGVPLSGIYGMSEVHALFAFRGGEPDKEARWRAGGPLISPQAACRVADDELQLQGPSLFEGYLADGGEQIDAELTASNFDGPWFKTGDLGKIDGDRSFEYITRMGDVMRLGGFLVAPAEVEATLMTHGSIAEAQVVAVGLEQGARPVAFVILSPDARLDEQAVIAHCTATLAKFKCPVRIVAIDEFPVTDGPNGVKIQRTKLRAMGEELL